MHIIEYKPEKIQEFGLGLIATQVDERNKNFPLKALLEAEPPPPPRDFRYHNSNGWWGNQFRTSKCVGYSTIQWLEDSPVTRPETKPGMDHSAEADEFYRRCQLVDEWPGENYDGTSTNAAMKILMEDGYIKSYHWGYDFNTIIQVLLHKSSILVGTAWYEAGFYPDSKGRIKMDGDIVGGHQHIWNGINLKTKEIRGKSSWGIDWSPTKNYWLSFKDAEKLIDKWAEFSLAVQVKRAAA